MHGVWSSHAVDLTIAKQSMDYDIPGGKPNRCPSIAYLVTRSSSASFGDVSTEPGASSGASTSPRFATASGDPSIAPMSTTAMAAAGARASALRENSGFGVYERVAPFGLV